MTPNYENQGDLSARLLKGDREALAKLLAENRQRLWRTIYFRLDPCMAARVDPDDILQDVFIAASLRLPHYSEQRHFSPFVWLRMIVGQTLIDVHRQHVGAQQRDARREITIHDHIIPHTSIVTFAGCHIDQATSPSLELLRAERVEKLREAMEALEPIDQEVIALRHFEELANKEVAEVLGIGPKAASIRYVRAIARLKEVAKATPGLTELLAQKY